MLSMFKKEKPGVNKEIRAFLSGKAVGIEEVPDDVFSNKVLGEGIAIIPTDDVWWHLQMELLAE